MWLGIDVGGAEPTITDANVALGGDMELDVEGAKTEC